MISALGVLCFLVVRSWLPQTAHSRLSLATGRAFTLAPDERFVAWRSHRRRQRRGQPDTTRLLQMLVGELAAGVVTPTAFVQVLGLACVSPRELEQSPPTFDAHIWSDVAKVWAVSDRAGLSMAVALQRIHAYALVDQEVAREVQANSAAPRFAVMTLVMLPVLAWMTAGATGARPIEFLTTTAPGWICLVVGAALFAGAVLWMRMLTRQALA